MLTSETIQVYNWFDLEKELCLIMNIPHDKFRDYDKIVGGEYKDLWHVALDTFVPTQMANDSIVKIYYYGGDFADKDAWKNVLITAWNTLAQRLDPSDHGIYVKFSW